MNGRGPGSSDPAGDLPQAVRVACAEEHTSHARTVNFILGAEVLRRRKRESTGRLRAPLVNLMTLNRCTLSLEFLRVKRVSTCEAKQQQND